METAISGHPKVQTLNGKGPAVVTCSEIGLVHSVGMAGLQVYSGTFFEDNPAIYSGYSKKKLYFSSYSTENYIKELCEYGTSFPERPVLLSDDDEGLLLISKHREKLDPYYRFLLPDKDMVENLLDKRKFCELCNDYDLPAPLSFEISSIADLERALTNISFPCIIKPAFKQDWWHEKFEQLVGTYKKAIRVDDPSALRELYKKIEQINPRAVLQEYVVGDDDHLYSVNMYVDQNSDLKGIFLAQKRRVYPITAGTGCYVVTVYDKDIIDLSVDVVRKLNLRGLLNIQFKRDARTSEPKLMEIHVRNSFWAYLGTAAGMNLSALYYRDLTGYKPNCRIPDTPDDYEIGVKFFDLGKDIKSFFQYRKEGLLTFQEWIKSYQGKHVFGGMLKKDPVPVLINLWFLFQRRMKSRLINRA